jgi:hypothetical protein
MARSVAVGQRSGARRSGCMDAKRADAREVRKVMVVVLMIGAFC